MKTPYYEYSRQTLQSTIDELTSLKTPYGLTVRYALKANPHPEIIKMVNDAGIHFDASSSYEVSELLKQGIDATHISLSSQQSAHNLQEILDAGVHYVATSLSQVRAVCELTSKPSNIALRINPGIGAGGNNRTSTGGVNASFGIWHEYTPDALTLCEEANIVVDRVHIHVGSGADPSVWDSVMLTSLEVMEQVPSATTLDIGGGFKVFRYAQDKEADMPAIMEAFSKRLNEFAKEHGRELKLEIEPGTYMVAHCGTLVAFVDDIVDTGKNGFTFLRLNAGMNDFMRPTLYGAEHKIEVVSDSNEQKEYIVVGHNCESGDILTPQPGDPEGIKPRSLAIASIGDEVRISDTGAYCASMRAKGYNAFPDAEEIFVD